VYVYRIDESLVLNVPFYGLGDRVLVVGPSCAADGTRSR